MSDELTRKYGKGFDKRSLYRYVQFYKTYPEIVGTLTPQSVKGGILSWSHYERLLQVPDSAARAWYEKEAIEQSWSVRTLRRNIGTQYYNRMILSTDKESVKAEMQEKTSPYQQKYEFSKQVSLFQSFHR